MRAYVAARSLSVIALLAIACTPPVEKPKEVAIASFEVSPARLAKGGAVTLSWSITGDIGEIALLRGQDVIEQPVDATGSFEVTNLPVGQQSFRIVVRGRGGDEVSRDGSASVFDVPAIAAFGADRTEVRVGTTVVLTWRTATADSVTVTGSDNSSVAQVTGDAAAAGTANVTPTGTTTYTLTAVGVGGSSQATVVVTVLPLPVIATLTAAPARVLAGQPVTVSWTTSQATSLGLRVGERTVFNAAASAVASGTRTVIPTESTTYTAVAAGPGGTVTRDVAVEVVPLPRVARFVAEPSEVVEGGSSTLRWEFVGVDSVVLTANGEPVELTEAGPTGSLDVTPARTTVYELTGTGEGGSVTASLAVTVIGVPAIVSFETDKNFVFRNRESATLSWVARNATVASIADSEGNLVDLGSRDPNGASVQVMPEVTTNYTLTIAGPGGTATAQLVEQIVVDDPAPNVTLTASASQVILGTTADLTWRLVDATSFTITALVAGSQTPVSLDLTGKSFDDVLTLPNPTDDTTYTLHAIGLRPDLTATATVSIRVVRLPSFVRFTSDRLRAAPGGGEEVLVTAGRNHNVTWETIDATDVRFDPAMLSASSGTYVPVRGNPAAVPITGFSSFDDSVITLTFPEGFAFPWFGTAQTVATVSTNGWLCLGAGCASTSSLFSSFGTALPNNVIAAFADDLLAVASEAPFNYLLEGTAPNRALSIEWGQIGLYANTAAGKISAKIKMYEDGRWEIWNDTRPALSSGATDAEIERYGTFARIGFEGPGGVPAMVHSNNSSVGLCGKAVTTADPSCPNQINVVQPLRLSPSGSAELRGEANACLKLIATGPVGSTTSPCLVVRTVPETTVGYFGGVRLPSNAARAAALNSGAGESIRLDYDLGPTTTGVVTQYGIINKNSGRLEVGTNTLSGQIVVAPAETTTYQVFAENEAGDRQTREVTVNIAAPTGTLAVAPASGQIGDPFVFSWTSQGARTLRILSPSGAVVGRSYAWEQTSDQTLIATGSLTANLTETGTYTLELVNGSGTSTVTTPVEVVGDLRIVGFVAKNDRGETIEEATAESNVVLAYETLNATGLVIEKLGTTAPVATLGAAAARRGTAAGSMNATTTTFVLTATGAGGATVSRTVSVSAVPKASIPTFVASSPVISFGGETTLSWTTENAVTVRLYTLGTPAPVVPPATPLPAPVTGEVLAARDQTSGNLVVSPVRTTGYRLVVTNRLNSATTRELDPPVTVSQLPPVISQFDVTPGDTIANGAQALLSWNSNQAENVYLWMRNKVLTGTTPPPPDEVSDTDDPVNVPYDYSPYNFEDISATGTEIVPGWGPNTAPLTLDLDEGYGLFDLPEDFRPHFFGEDMGRVLVSTNGGMFLAPPGAADSYFDVGGSSQGTNVSQGTSCRPLIATDGCGTLFPSSILSSTGTVRSNRIFPFFSNLAACVPTSTTAPGTCSVATRTPGKIFRQVVGAAPNRRLIVQWNQFEGNTSTNAGTLTFQAKLHENGDVEFQYKRMEAAAPAFAKGASAIIGVDKRAYKGRAINYFLSLSASSQTITPGDGYIIYSGRRPASGTLKTFAKRLITTAPARFPFRLVATNSRETESRVTVLREPLQGLGQNDLFLTELMVDPAVDDVGKEWIELRNIRTAPAQLANFTIQTSSGSFLIPGGTVPASGAVVLGQSNVTAENGGIPVSVVYGNRVEMDDVSDSVIVRVGNALIDRVEYDGTGGWRIPRGKSMAFGGVTSVHTDNDLPGDWCTGRDPLNASAVGTPGAVNPSCYGFEVIPFDPSWDISAVAGVTVIASGAIDDTLYSTPLVIPYNHFGDAYAGGNISVSSNGWLSIGAAATSSVAGNSTLPYISTSIPGDMIAPYWDDAKGLANGRMITTVVGTAPNRAQVVMWDLWGAPYTAPPAGKFGVALLESGNPVLFYVDLAGMTGAAATVGVEARQKRIGIQFTYNAAMVGITTPTAIRPRRFD